MTAHDDAIAAALDAVRARIAAAAVRAGRTPDAVQLVAVTKTVPVERIASALAAGVVDVGENRAQELRAKVDALPHARWHFIGSLQRNKVRDVVGRATLIHSVDRVPLAAAIGEAARARGLVQPVLLQVNVSGEPTKHGVPSDRAAPVADAVAATDGLALRGLMTIAPASGGDAARRCFAALRVLRDALARDLPDLQELSMGMSGDLEEAVEEGATIVRVGTAIFGTRPRTATGQGRRGRAPK